MKQISLTALALSAGLLLAACGDDTDTYEETAPPPEEASTTADPAMPADDGMDNMATLSDDALDEEQDTLGGAGTLVVLEPLDTTVAAGVRGELGCSFAGDETGETLLLAKADVDDNARPEAVISEGGTPVLLTGEQTGGFSALEPDGGVFAGGGYVVELETGDRNPADGTEQVGHTATLTVNSADGTSRVYDGEWVCGP